MKQNRLKIENEIMSIKENPIEDTRKWLSPKFLSKYVNDFRIHLETLSSQFYKIFSILDEISLDAPINVDFLEKLENKLFSPNNMLFLPKYYYTFYEILF